MRNGQGSSTARFHIQSGRRKDCPVFDSFLPPFCSVLSCPPPERGGDRSAIHAPPCAPHPVESSVQICQSACPCRSLVRCTPLYSFVDSLNRSFHPRGPDIFHPPLTLNPRCTSGDAQSPGDFYFFLLLESTLNKQTRTGNGLLLVGRHVEAAEEAGKKE